MKRLCLLFVLILISGCVSGPLTPPERLDPLAGLDITLSPTYGDLSAGLIYSEYTTKRFFDYKQKEKQTSVFGDLFIAGGIYDIVGDNWGQAPVIRYSWERRPDWRSWQRHPGR